MAFNPVAAYLYPRYGPKFCIVLGSLIALIGLFASTYTTNFALFTIFYGLFYGIGIGLSYLAPLMCGWEHFPERKGMVSGIIIGGFGFGSFIFDMISTILVNPQDIPPSIEIKSGQTEQFYFDTEISNRAPIMLRKLIAIWAIMIAISLPLIRKPKNTEEGDQDNVSLRAEESDKRYIHIIKSRKFILLWIMLFLSNCK